MPKRGKLGKPAAPPKARRARSPGERASAIAREIASRLGLGDVKRKESRRTVVAGKSGIALIKGRKRLGELRGTAPGEAIRKALPKSGQRYLANVRVKIGREWRSLSALTKNPDRLTYGMPKKIRAILAGKDSPKAKVVRRAAMLTPPTVTAVEVYVTRDTGKRRARQSAAMGHERKSKRGKRRGKGR